MGNKIMSKMAVKYTSLKEKVKEKLKEESGNWLGKGLEYFAEVLIGAIVIGALVLIFKDTLIPTLIKKIKDVFNIT